MSYPFPSQIFDLDRCLADTTVYFVKGVCAHVCCSRLSLKGRCSSVATVVCRAGRGSGPGDDVMTRL